MEKVRMLQHIRDFGNTEKEETLFVRVRPICKERVGKELEKRVMLCIPGLCRTLKKNKKTNFAPVRCHGLNVSDMCWNVMKETGLEPSAYP